MMDSSGILYTWCMAVRTSTYRHHHRRHVPVCTDLYSCGVCTGLYFWKTFACQYIPVHTRYRLGQMTKSTTVYVLLAVHGSIWQYMAVQGITWLYIFWYVPIPSWYVLVRLSTNFVTVLLDFVPEISPCWKRWFRRQCMQVHQFMHKVDSSATFARGLSTISLPGCLAAAGGSGAVAPSAAACRDRGRCPRIGPSAGCGRKMHSFEAKRRLMIMGWGRPQAEGILKKSS